MPRYVTPDVVEQARKVDLLSYFQATAPNELVRCGAEEYCTREHDSLKISHGKWYWWSRGGWRTAPQKSEIRPWAPDFPESTLYPCSFSG